MTAGMVVVCSLTNSCFPANEHPVVSYYLSMLKLLLTVLGQTPGHVHLYALSCEINYPIDDRRKIINIVNLLGSNMLRLCLNISILSP